MVKKIELFYNLIILSGIIFSFSTKLAFLESFLDQSKMILYISGIVSCVICCMFLFLGQKSLFLIGWLLRVEI